VIADVMISDPLNRFLWGIAATILFLTALQYFNIARKREESNIKILMYGFSLSFLGSALAISFWSFAELAMEGQYIGHIYVGDFSTEKSIFGHIGDLSNAIGSLMFIIAFEKSDKNSKHILSGIGVTTLIIYMILLATNNLYFANPLLVGFYIPFVVISYLGILFFFTKWADPEFKAISSIVMFGSAFFFYGLILNNAFIKNVNLIPLFVAPIFVIVGAIFMILPSVLSTEQISQGKNYWLLFSLPSIVIGWILLILLPLSQSLFILGFILNLVLLYFPITLIDFKKKEQTGLRDKEIPHFLKGFVKPPKLTEEEVTVSKEKKICLVCKGKVLGFNSFICKCDTIYCQKCARTLSNLENACWVCETPFDETKAVKFHGEPSSPYIEDTSKKKVKK
jgi:hypothetical protein